MDFSTLTNDELLNLRKKLIRQNNSEEAGKITSVLVQRTNYRF